MLQNRKINKKNTTNQSRKLLQVNFWPKPSMQNSLISNFSITSLIIMQTSESDPVHDLSLSKLFILFKYIFVVSKYRSKLMLTHRKIEIKMHQKIYAVLQKCVVTSDDWIFLGIVSKFCFYLFRKGLLGTAHWWGASLPPTIPFQ